jgi:hypothetical protein
MGLPKGGGTRIVFGGVCREDFSPKPMNKEIQVERLGMEIILFWTGPVRIS